jgi:TPP-dependent pyruvate/acetoin dehydrogenase alpha subunit
MTDINRYLDFVLKLFFAFGVAFEIPIAALLLIWAGITTPDSLGKQAALHHRRLLRLRHAADTAGRDLPVAAGAAHVAALRGRRVHGPGAR